MIVGCDVINSEIDLIFVIKLLFLYEQKVKRLKIKYLENEKRF